MGVNVASYAHRRGVIRFNSDLTYEIPSYADAEECMKGTGRDDVHHRVVHEGMKCPYDCKDMAIMRAGPIVKEGDKNIMVSIGPPLHPHGVRRSRVYRENRRSGHRGQSVAWVL